MSKSVVIGGAGFVGSWVVEELLKQTDDQIIIVDNLLSSDRWNISLDNRIQFILGSAGDAGTLMNIKGQINSVYHLACYHGNQSSIANPLADFENSLKPTITILDWIEKHHPLARVVYAGAGCAVAQKIWGDAIGTREVEEISILQDTPYSISKITSEMYAAHYAQKRGLDVVRVRFQNAFGPREILGAGTWRGTQHTIWRNVIPTFIWKANRNETLYLFGENASRDFVYVEDLAQGVLLANMYGKSGEVYNLASGVETKISEIARMIIEISGSSSEMTQLPSRDWDSSGNRFGDTSKSAVSIGFTSKIEVEKGLESTYEWMLTNYSRIEASIARHLSTEYLVNDRSPK